MKGHFPTVAHVNDVIEALYGEKYDPIRVRHWVSGRRSMPLTVVAALAESMSPEEVADFVRELGRRSVEPVDLRVHGRHSARRSVSERKRRR